MAIAIELKVLTSQYFGLLLLAITLATIGNTTNIPMYRGISYRLKSQKLLCK